jgi:hypothetical protein
MYLHSLYVCTVCVFAHPVYLALTTSKDWKHTCAVWLAAEIIAHVHHISQWYAQALLVRFSENWAQIQDLRRIAHLR